MSIKKLMITKAPTVHEPELMTQKDFSEDCKAFFGESNLQDYYSLSTSEETKLFTQVIAFCIDQFSESIQKYYDHLPPMLKHCHQFFPARKYQNFWAMPSLSVRLLTLAKMVHLTSAKASIASMKKTRSWIGMNATL